MKRTIRDRSNNLKHGIVPMLAALLLLITACGNRQTEQQLDLAEAAMTQRSDSALTLLQSLDGAKFGGELQARHALLLSQTYDKNYIDIADDSLINIAFDYYRLFSADDRRLMQAAYYKAVVIYNGGNYLQSMKYAAMADTLANRLRDHKFAGLSASMMLYNSMFLFSNQSEIDFGIKARRHFYLAKDEKNANIISFYLAHALMNANRFSEATTIIDSISNHRSQTELRAYLYSLTRQNDKVDSILNIFA